MKFSYHLGSVNYLNETIYIRDENMDWVKEYGEDNFVTQTKLIERINEKTIDIILKLKDEKESDIKSSKLYSLHKIRIQNMYKEDMIFSKLGAGDVYYTIEDWKIDVKGFIYHLPLIDMILMDFGDTKKSYEYAEEIIQKEWFIATEIILPELEKEVDEYISAGNFSQREKDLILFIEKTSINAKKFKIDDIYGNEMLIKNGIKASGEVTLYGTFNTIDFGDIKTVYYRNKVIYSKY